MGDSPSSLFGLEAAAQGGSVDSVLFGGRTEIRLLLASQISNRCCESFIIDHGSALQRDGSAESGRWSYLGGGRLVAGSPTIWMNQDLWLKPVNHQKL